MAPCSYDEKNLLALVAEGDEMAFRQLFLHWHPLLAGYIFRITESREMTEEIVQDVFLKIWMIRETLTSVENFKHFLLVVGRNKTFDALKKQLREKRRHRAWQAELQPEGQPAENELDLLRLSLIDHAIESLPPRQKEVFLLSRNDRLTYKEIAGRLEISPESVKTHIRLASISLSRFVRQNLGNTALLVAGILEIF